MHAAEKDLETVCTGLLDDGDKILLITFTLPHADGDTIYYGVRSLLDCIRGTLSGRGSSAIKKEYGISKVSTTKEATFLAPHAQRSKDFLHGMHFHEHSIFSVSPNHTLRIASLQRDLATRWADTALAIGAINQKKYRSVLRHGVKISTPPPASDRAEEVSAIAKYAVKGLGKYVTSSAKLSRDNDRIDSFTMRNLALSDCPQYLPILGEFLQAVKGVPMHRITPAIKRRYISSDKKKPVATKTYYKFESADWLMLHASGRDHDLAAGAASLAPEQQRTYWTAATYFLREGRDPVDPTQSLLCGRGLNSTLSIYFDDLAYKKPPSRQVESWAPLVRAVRGQYERLAPAGALYVPSVPKSPYRTIRRADGTTQTVYRPRRRPAWVRNWAFALPPIPLSFRGSLLDVVRTALDFPPLVCRSKLWGDSWDLPISIAYAADHVIADIWLEEDPLHIYAHPARDAGFPDWYTRSILPDVARKALLTKVMQWRSGGDAAVEQPVDVLPDDSFTVFEPEFDSVPEPIFSIDDIDPLEGMEDPFMSAA